MCCGLRLHARGNDVCPTQNNKRVVIHIPRILGLAELLGSVLHEAFTSWTCGCHNYYIILSYDTWTRLRWLMDADG